MNPIPQITNPLSSEKVAGGSAAGVGVGAAIVSPSSVSVRSGSAHRAQKDVKVAPAPDDVVDAGDASARPRLLAYLDTYVPPAGSRWAVRKQQLDAERDRQGEADAAAARQRQQEAEEAAEKAREDAERSRTLLGRALKVTRAVAAVSRAGAAGVTSLAARLRGNGPATTAAAADPDEGLVLLDAPSPGVGVGGGALSPGIVSPGIVTAAEVVSLQPKAFVDPAAAMLKKRKERPPTRLISPITAADFAAALGPVQVWPALRSCE